MAGLDRVRPAVAAVLIASIACGRADARLRATTDSVRLAAADSIARARQDSINRARPDYVVDSILPIEEELRRFRIDITQVPTRFVGGASSRNALVERFVRAVGNDDTTALASLALSRAEFAYLVYPASPYTTAPRRQAPGLLWMLMQHESATGFHRLRERLSGRPLRLISYRCTEQAEQQRANALWKNCVLRLSANGDTLSARLFGTVIERGGRWKLIGFGNDF